MKTPLVVAFEGVTCSGKSTLLRELPSLLNGRVQVFPCYVEMAGGDALVPNAPALSVEEQLAAVDFFLKMELRRFDLLDKKADIVLLDRSIYTICAHSYSISKKYDMPVFERTEQIVKNYASKLTPDWTFLMKADRNELLVRYQIRQVDITSLFADDVFNTHFEEYFSRFIIDNLTIMNTKVAIHDIVDFINKLRDGHQR